MTDVDMRRRRALYRAQHRGTKEMDHVVGRYAEAHLGAMGVDELDIFERFLALPDPLLQAWVMGADVAVTPEYESLVRDLRRHHGLSERPQGERAPA